MLCDVLVLFLYSMFGLFVFCLCSRALVFCFMMLFVGVCCDYFRIVLRFVACVICVLLCLFLFICLLCVVYVVVVSVSCRVFECVLLLCVLVCCVMSVSFDSCYVCCVCCVVLVIVCVRLAIACCV